MTASARLEQLGITLPAVGEPRWIYDPAVRAGALIFVSGQIGIVDGRIAHPGKVGHDVSVEDARTAARLCAIQALAIAAREAGAVDRIAHAVKTTVFVASAPGFGDQPTVADGATELLRDVLGAPGARSAVGVAELPLGASVEAEFIFAVHG